MFPGNHSRWARPPAGLVLVVPLLAAVIGCGGANPFDMAPASGKITYEDGSVISGTRLQLEFFAQVKPIDNKHPRAGIAEVNMTDGTFSEVTTDPGTPGDGLIIGEHEVVATLSDDSGKDIQLTLVEPKITVEHGENQLVILAKKP